MAHKNMVDLGEKMSRGEISPPKQPQVFHPSFSSNKDLGLTENDAGKTILAIVKLKIKRAGKIANEQGKKHINDFEVLSMIPNPNLGRSSHYNTN